MTRTIRYGTFDAGDHSFGSFVCHQWAAAAQALRLPRDGARQTESLLREILADWFDAPVGRACRTPSYVAADGFPAELSVNWSGAHPELRILFDAGFRSPRPTDTAREVTRALAGRPGVGLDRYLSVEDVFLGDTGHEPAPLWHALAWRPGEGLTLKAYFGLYPWDHRRREAVIGQAMERLGMGAAWRNTARAHGALPGDRELEFFALDLSDAPGARAKVYYRHHDADLDTLDAVASTARAHDPLRASEVFRMLAGPHHDTGGEAPLTCLAFRGGADRADEASTYLRMPNLCENEREATRRVEAVLLEEGIPTGPYRALVDSLAPQPLDAFTGLQELVSFRTGRRRGDVTTYLRFSVYPGPHSDAHVPQRAGAAEPSPL
ncbi:tryptophan dimethylallyltransferase family protein [Streptomyces niveiscabiei]|uniref:Tryptophan dimethylallyltransferase family protein n=1 Tax=Streptomyces niveiscabiei TaxID=164115 RepID=A0ABW9HRN1_9ACTN